HWAPGRLADVAGSPVGAAVTAIVGSGRAWLSIRRIVFLGVALVPARVHTSLAAAVSPSVTIAIPAHNEEDLVDGLVSSLDRLDYPRERLSTLFVCDGCTFDLGRLLV